MMSLLVPGESGIEDVEVDGFHGFSVLSPSYFCANCELTVALLVSVIMLFPASSSALESATDECACRLLQRSHCTRPAQSSAWLAHRRRPMARPVHAEQCAPESDPVRRRRARLRSRGSCFAPRRRS